MAVWVNRRIWPNVFVCPQKVHRLSKADRAIRAKINTYHPGEGELRGCVTTLPKKYG